LTTTSTTDGSDPTAEAAETAVTAEAEPVEATESAAATEPAAVTEPAADAEAPAAEVAEAAPEAAEADPADTSEATETTEAAATSGASPSRGSHAGRQSPAAKPPRRPAPVCQTTGRRKQAVARVRFRPGNGTITINKRPFDGYFTSATHRMIVSEPLRLSNVAERYDIDATIDGGGTSGQAGALRLGIARALIKIDPELRIGLKRAGLLTRDAREKESKKYGLKKARKAPQYSKR
jgi:small subunit ribosomal protein S9